MDMSRVLNLLDELRSEIAGIVTPPVVDPTVPEDAPFGYDLSGKPRFAPAYDACRAMWEAAQREGWMGVNGHPFTIFDYVPGLQMAGDPPRRAPHQGDLRKLENDIVALAYTEQGAKWLSFDENACMVSPAYQRRFLGYAVRVSKDSFGNRTYVRVA